MRVFLSFFIFSILFFPINAQNINKEKEVSLDLIIPSHFDVDASVLQSKWYKGYASNKQGKLPCQKLTKKIVMPSTFLLGEKIKELPTTLQIPNNKLVRKGIEAFLIKRKALIPFMLSWGDYYFPFIEEILVRYKVPIELKYLIVVESGMNPNVTSVVGAAGLWQFTLSAAKVYGLKVNSLIDERLDLLKSTDAAARYLRDLHQIYNDWFLAIAAYNCGMGRVNRAIVKAKGKRSYWSIYPYLPKQTRNYIPLFIGVFYTMNFHREYGICPNPNEFPLAVDTLHLQNTFKIKDIVKMAQIDLNLFEQLNPHFRAGVIPGAIVKSTVYLPLIGATNLYKGLDSISKISFKDRQDYFLKNNSLAKEIADKNPIKKRERLKKYKIRRGDTLSSIARRHGISIKKLMKLNRIKTVHHVLLPGKYLRVPIKNRRRR